MAAPHCRLPHGRWRASAPGARHSQRSRMSRAGCHSRRQRAGTALASRPLQRDRLRLHGRPRAAMQANLMRPRSASVSQDFPMASPNSKPRPHRPIAADPHRRSQHLLAASGGRDEGLVHAVATDTGSLKTFDHRDQVLRQPVEPPEGLCVAAAGNRQQEVETGPVTCAEAILEQPHSPPLSARRAEAPGSGRPVRRGHHATCPGVAIGCLYGLATAHPAPTSLASCTGAAKAVALALVLDGHRRKAPLSTQRGRGRQAEQRRPVAHAWGGALQRNTNPGSGAECPKADVRPALLQQLLNDRAGCSNPHRTVAPQSHGSTSHRTCN